MATLAATPDATAPSSPQQRAVHITEQQKQALMDNLQLEVADRARKLRAQYALQAQGLRTRLEMRINRIPHSLRRANMGELLQKHLDAQNKPQQKAPSPLKPTRGLKRKSDEVPQANDKENTQPATALANPKKRSKPNAAPAPPPTGIPLSPNLNRSKRPQPLANTTAVLSPKSPNSRTIPRSPIKSPASAKSPPPLPRPRGTVTQQSTISSKKGTLKRPATAPTSTTIQTAIEAGPQNGTIRRGARRSDASENSTSSEKTTIVNKSAKSTTQYARPATAMAASSPKKLPIPVPAAAAKQEKTKEKTVPTPTGTVKKGTFKSALSSLTGSKRGKKAAAAAKENGTPPPATSTAGRVLRKRA